MIKVGDKVKDDLTGQIQKVIRISEDGHGNVGVWLDCEYLDGGRHPWEVTEMFELPNKEPEDE